MSIPNRDIIRTKNFFNITKCENYWAQSGDYLIVKLERQKTKTVSVMSLEIFRIREKDVPVDVIEMKPSEEITGLFFEPKGNRFVLFVQFEMNTFTRFFEVEKKKPGAVAGVKLLKELDTKGLDYCSWSPDGRFMVLCGLKSTGDLQFWDIKDLTLFASQEHYGVKQIQWDPTGRYVTTTNTSWKTQNDTGLMMWNLSGTELNKQSITGFKQFAWRPRPLSILDEQMQKQIKKNLKTYSKEFDMEDSMESNKASQDVQEKRREMWKEYNEMLKEFALKVKEEEKERIKMYGFDPNNLVIETLEETVEVIEETEEVVPE
jgi:translation initiation factor 3 subunit B